MESQAQLPQQHRSQTPSLQNFNIPKLRGAQPTCLPNSTCLESTATEGGLPEETNAIGDSRKTTETEARSSLATVDTCTVPGWSIPGKFGYQPIKLEICPLVHTHTANYVRVHLRYLGVYKESRVAYRAIRVRVS